MSSTLRTITNGRLVEGEKLDNLPADTNAQLATKQATLVSGTNIKTLNGESILGDGNLVIVGGGFRTDVPGTPTRVNDTSFTITDTANANLYDQLLQRGTVLKRTQSGTKQAMVVSATYSSDAVTVTLIGDTFAAGFSDVKYGLHKADYSMFVLTGAIGTIASGVANKLLAGRPAKVYGLDARCDEAGSGTTTFDINKNGTSMFTVNPSITTTNDSVFGVSADDGAFMTTLDEITMDVVAVAGTPIQGAYIRLWHLPLYMANLA